MNSNIIPSFQVYCVTEFQIALIKGSLEFEGDNKISSAPAAIKIN